METRKQLITSVEFTRGPAGDSLDFVNVLEKVELAMRSVRIVVADKGYDSERNHEYAPEGLGAETVISVRAASRPKIKLGGRRRKRQLRDVLRKEHR